MTRDAVERAMQLSRAELVAARHRIARRNHLREQAAQHHVDIGAIPTDDELAVARAIARLEAHGVPLDQALINPPTAAQILGGHTQGGTP